MTEKNDVDLVIRRRKRRLPERDRRSTKVLILRLSFLLACLFFLYTIGAIYSPWTGVWGEHLALSLLNLSGGAVVIPLFLSSYVLFSLGTGRFISDIKGQLGGTVALYFSSLLLTGFMGMSTDVALPFSPGALGFALTEMLLGIIGKLGTMLVAILVLFMSAVLYGVVPFAGWDLGRLSETLSMVLSRVSMRMRSIRLKKPMSKELDLDEEQQCPQDIPREEESPSQGSEEEVVIEEPSVVRLIRPVQVKPTPVVMESEENDDDDEDELTEFEPEPKATLSVDILGPKDTGDSLSDPMVLRQRGLDIVTALSNFGVEAELADALEGPSVVQYQIQLAPGVKVSKVAGLSKDLAVAMAVHSLRVEAPIPGTSYVGIEIPNKKRRPVTLRSVMESDQFRECDFSLPLPMGLKIDGSPLVVGLEDLPHLLVAGTTGSGKSVFVTSCITAMCATRTPKELRLILIDPKRVEMAIYEKLPHVLAKPVVDPHKAVQALSWAVKEMERRYEVFARSKVRNLESYNNRVGLEDRLPHIVVVVDELADLMFTASKDVEDYICRLAQMARATGIHLMLATQRPSVNVITGLIKANIPARAAFTLPSQTDSRTIIDVSGAQQLLGKGDMLFTSTRHPKPVRLQAPFIDENDSLNVIDSLRVAYGDPVYVELEDAKAGSCGAGGDFFEEDRLEEAIGLVMNSGIASASRLQRQMRVGFTRAARMIDTMEQMGIIGPQEGSKPREIYVDEEGAEEIIGKFRQELS